MFQSRDFNFSINNLSRHTEAKTVQTEYVIMLSAAIASSKMVDFNFLKTLKYVYGWPVVCKTTV